MNKLRKKILIYFVICILLLPITNVDIQGASNQEIYAGNQLRILGVLKGYNDGSLKLDSNIVRSEVATLVIRIISDENQIILGEEKEFTDVEQSYWAYNNIQNAYKLGIIKGYPSGEFKPLNNISYAEVVAIMVNALGEGNDLEGDWPYNYINKAKEIGVIPADSSVDPNKIVTRGEMAVIIWDSLLVKK